jgi:hypothetical protein
MDGHEDVAEGSLVLGLKDALPLNLNEPGDFPLALDVRRLCLGW